MSLLPLKVLYLLSDFLCFLAYRVIRYRRRIVRDNIAKSFPQKSEQEIIKIEKDFYAFFCDYLVETIKLCTISDKQLKRRMKFIGVEEMVNEMKRENKLFSFIYLAHYGNWEWISSLSARIHEVDNNIVGGHIYHPLRNKTINKLFLKLRSRFEGTNIPMKGTLRFILRQRQLHKPTIIGFIADQSPKWNCIHHWTNFMNRITPVFTGTEKIAKQVDAQIYFADVRRVKRGYYECTLTRMTDNISSFADYEITDKYFKMLEQMISNQTFLWLWSHNRWKRTYEEYVERNNSDNRK